MFQKIKNFFSPPKPFPPITFETLGTEELKEKHPDALMDLFEGRKHGFLVEGFLSEEEVGTVLSNFHKVLDSDVANTDVGFTYPSVFAELSRRIENLPEKDKSKTITEYFIKNETYRNNFVEEYGVDIPNKLSDLFTNISAKRNVGPPKGVNDAGLYPFGTYRYLKPKEGLMSVHCGNYFQKEFLDFYQHLSSKVEVKDQLSYFIVLKQAEIGGELSIFNLRWEDGQMKPNPSVDDYVDMPDGSQLFVDKDPRMQKIKLNPKPGDMIIFQGGNIWHRVEKVFGSNERITFGGFMGFSFDKKEVFYWS